MKKIVLFLMVLLVSNTLFANTLYLKKGWNLVGINGNLPLSTLQTQVGNDNLLVAQAQEQVYKKAYVDEGKSNLNDLSTLDVGKGYWVQLANEPTSPITYTPAQNTTNNFTLNLKTGWNLISPPVAMTLGEIKQQISSDNLLVIQSSKDTYQKYYVDIKKEFLNDFSEFSVGNGYWVKVKSDVDLNFVFSVDK